ncbi:hypothetical protein N8737_02975 [Verrucomicrobia bacterium]|nr:hypothetical protein [Verrucomicrobiota bacterium]MDB4796624.1 hypothetical protein [bacterium]
MNHSRIRRSVWTFVAGLLSISNLVTAQDATPVDDLDIVVYQSDFSSPVGSEWSSDSISVTPRDSRSFLGEFDGVNQSVELNLASLPAHQSVTVRFDLFVLHTWDGNQPGVGIGPDIWQLRVKDGEILIRTTFSNGAPYAAGQSYPDDFDADDTSRFDAFSGALEIGSLGYGLDSVYQIERTFSHSDAALVLEFSGVGVTDESWGLDRGFR